MNKLASVVLGCSLTFGAVADHNAEEQTDKYIAEIISFCLFELGGQQRVAGELIMFCETDNQILVYTPIVHWKACIYAVEALAELYHKQPNCLLLYNGKEQQMLAQQIGAEFNIKNIGMYLYNATIEEVHDALEL